MKPINSQDRSKAIIRFTLLLALTIIIVIMAVFFDYKVPEKENKFLREKIKSTEKLMSTEQEFANNVKDIKSLIDSMSIPGVNSQFISKVINDRLVKAESTIQKDSTFRKAMYTNILKSLLELSEAKSTLLSQGDLQSEMKELSQELDQCANDKEQAERDLDLCRRLSN